MKFKDLEIGQTFRHGESLTVCVKTDSGGYKVVGEPDKHICYVSKAARNYSVIPESEPPSMIAAAKRDARWHLLDDMDVKAEDVKALRDREGIGVYEGARMLKRHNLQQGLDVLAMLNKDGTTEKEDVLHDLIEIVRELV